MTRHPPLQRWLRAQAGFTLLEAAFVLAIAAILLAAGVPSYRNMLENKRMRLAAETLQQDLQNARLLSSSGQASISFHSSPGNWCWGANVNAPCDCSSQMCGISTQRSSAYAGVILVHSDDTEFQGGSSHATSYGLTEFSTSHGGQVRVVVSPIGRATLCGKDAPGGAVPCPGLTAP